jgi:hypothetical protein
MKKKQILVSLCLMSFLLCNCNMWENELFDDVQVPEKTYLPANIEEYGKEVAAELYSTVKNLNKMGVDYSNANSSETFKDRFFSDYYKASSIKTKSGTLKPTQMPSNVFAERLNNLTQIQLEFIDRIIDECDKSKSYPDLAKRLINVNKDIHSDVPEIQQERLFTITAVLYYGIKEIQNLEEQGLMPRTPQSNIQYLRLKSGNTESGDSFGDSCRKFLAATWVIAIGEPTPVGEIVASVATVIVGGILLYEVVVCTVNTINCSAKYAECVNKGSLPRWKCYDCFVYCQGQNVWDCPRPY